MAQHLQNIIPIYRKFCSVDVGILNMVSIAELIVKNEKKSSVIADSALQLAFAAATGNFRSISALKSIHI